MKKVFKVQRAQGEEGMALLFALGFLALMLILGLGFVTTSLLAQKLAANNSSRAQARMFARSAAARAMLNIMLYNDQAILSGKTIEDYDSIRSYDQVKYNKSGSISSGSVADQLHRSSDNAADESKLKYQVGTEDYTGENSLAQWMYFYDSPVGTEGRRIIGRAAFQVLPRQAGRLSLYAITGGSLMEGDYRQKPHSFRWGRDIAELNLANTTTLPNWYDSGRLNVNNIPFKYETMYTSYGSFFTTDNEMKKKWLEYWFAEGKNSILKEAFPKSDKQDSKGKKVIYINRFNISDYYYKTADRNNAENDQWYDRFKKAGHRTDGWEGSDIAAKKNSSDALDMLAKDAVAYKESHSEDPEVNPSGLPFLKRIGNEKWSFENLEDRRRQIAANFNDYCDKDNIPTSNVKAAIWSVTESANFPVYTGNERTLYINEVALRLGEIKAKFTENGNLGTVSGTNHGNVEIDSITPTLTAELVNMYDPAYGDDAAKALLNPANFEFQTVLEKLSFDVALKAKFKFKYRYDMIKIADNSRETKTSSELEVTVDYAKGAVAKISVTPSASEAKTISEFKALGNGYSVGSVALDNITNDGSAITQNNKQIFANEIESKKNTDFNSISVPAGYKKEFKDYLDVNIVQVGIQLKTDENNSKVKFAPFLLKAKSTVADDVKGMGVDFVRMDRVGEMSLKGTPDAAADEDASGAEHTFKTVGMIGGIEARDPRQNLNPRYSETDTNVAKSSDWNLTPKLVLGGASGNTVPTMTLEAESCEATAGKVNRSVSPAAPKYVTNADDATANIDPADADKETATDPAWIGDAHGQHVSTAYIRNAPMVSPWEIGLIHRAREWQTLNLKRAGGFGDVAEIRLKDIDSGYENWTDPGTAYRNGDGGILEFVKVGIGCRCMGKVPLTLLRTEVIDPSGGSKWNNINLAYNKDIIKMLFDGIRKGQTMKQFYAETKFGAGNAVAQGGTAITASDANMTKFVSEVDRLCGMTGDKEFRMRSQFLNSDYGAVGTDNNPTSFSFGIAVADNDAQREEIIGKTINLLTVNEVTPPNIFRVIVVAQSIKDVGGLDVDIPVTKIHNGANRTLQCQIGRFDFVSDDENWENNTYFDEITGEVKMLVTIERIPRTDDIGQENKDFGRMVITGLEYVE